MSGTVEVTELSDLDLDSAPPCEFFDNYQQCGKPSVVRVRVACSCGGHAMIFLCEECLEMLKDGVAQCLACLNTDLNWGES